VHPKPFSLYETADYFRELSLLITATTPGNRIALMSMSFNPQEQHVHKLMRELIAAAQRGVEVHLVIDAISFYLDDHDVPTGPVLLRHQAATSVQTHFRQKYRILEELRAHGGHYRVINLPSRPFTNPYAGRSHIKAAIINDTIFIGGCNLSRYQMDYMVRFEDEKQANWLYTLATKVENTGHVRAVLDDTDREIIVDSKTTLLVDAGKPRQSIIYGSALDFIDSAQEWLVMTCQFFPNTITAKHLASAVKRGVRVVLYYNHPAHHAVHMRPLQRAVIYAEKARQPRVLFAYQLPKHLPRMHAKLIANEQGAMLGSHNYVTHGVNFGTAEIALRRYDPTFAYNSLRALQQLLPTNCTVPLLPILTD
jgi:phosphatidylserine/phosphatidylglycerophosphate/cardiolipin synthase-like enzyme